MTKSRHYALGTELVCGIQYQGYSGIEYTDAPTMVSGCAVCLEAAKEDLADVDVEHACVCQHCGGKITATGGVQWRRAIRGKCPGCERDGWFKGQVNLN